MKRFLTILCLIAVTFSGVMANDDTVEHSLGGSIRTPSIGLGISYQVKFQSYFAILTDLCVSFGDFYLETPHEVRTIDKETQLDHYELQGWDCGLAFHTISISSMFLYNSQSGNQYDFYAGAGPLIGHIIEGWTQQRDVQAGAQMCVGFEWHSQKQPLDIAFDFRPSISFYIDSGNEVYPSGIFMFPLTVTFRRRF